MTATTTKSAILGIVGVVAALLAVGLAPPTAQAQEESYINSCQPGCYTPPQTEEQCRDLANSRYYDENVRYGNRMSRLAKRRAKEIDESRRIFFDEIEAHDAVRDERIAIAYRAFAVKVAGATAGLTACLAKITVTGPAAIGAGAICSAAYSAAYANFLALLNSEIKDAGEDYRNQRDLATHRMDDRDDAIKALYDERLIPNEEANHESVIALIDEDLTLCLLQVRNYR